MAIQGGNFERTKHMICNENFIKDRLKNGEIILKYLSTNNMPADMLTKPISKAKLNQHTKTLSVVS